MAMSSRGKKAARAKRTTLFTLLFTALLAPALLLLLNKALPAGLWGNGTDVQQNVYLSLRQVSRGILEAVVQSEKNRPVTQSQKPGEKNTSVSDIRFSNKGSHNEIDNTQETTPAGTVGFSNEGDHNKIKNVQRGK